MRAQEAAPAISRLFQDKNNNVRQNAFQYLQQLKPEEAKEAVPALIAALKKPESQSDAIDQLKRIGPPAREAVPALNELLRSENPQLRGRVVEALKAISPDDKR